MNQKLKLSIIKKSPEYVFVCYRIKELWAMGYQYGEESFT